MTFSPSAFAAALPASFASALTQATSDDVDVDRVPQRPMRDVHVWVRPPLGWEPDGGGVAAAQVRRVYQVTIAKRGGDGDDLAEFAQEVTAYFHGTRRPNVTGLRRVLVEAMSSDLEDDQFGAPNKTAHVAVRFNLVAVTREPVTESA